MKERITRLFVLGALLLALNFPANAQQSAKVFRIEVLTSSTVAWQIEALRRGLGDRGYVEGKNIEIELRSAEGKFDRLPALAAELVQLKPGIIVTSSNPASVALKQATQMIPIVMTSVGDPVGAGFVSSLAHPGGNITGLSNIAEQLSGKRLGLLKETKPKIGRIALFRNALTPPIRSYGKKPRPPATRWDWYWSRWISDPPKISRGSST